MRFIENLATWLQQFEPAEREIAYGFVRRSLVYIGPGEMQRLVEQFYPGQFAIVCLRPWLPSANYPLIACWSDPAARADIQRLHRQTLFMGLSDGARIDTIRHANAGLLSNEQLVQGTQVDRDKWEDLRDNLRQDLSDTSAGFRLVYLIDDFAGSGTTFLRSNAEKGWKGKLMRFRESVMAATDALGPLLSPDWELCIHHYVASASAAENIRERLRNAARCSDCVGWARRCTPRSEPCSPRSADRRSSQPARRLYRPYPQILRPGDRNEAHGRPAASPISVSDMAVALLR